MVFDDNGVDGRIEGDTMGLHVAAIAPDGTVATIGHSAARPGERPLRRGAVARRASAQVFLEEHTLVYADGPDASAPRTILSETSGGIFGLWPASDAGKTLAAWSDFRDDELPRCLPVDCATDVYVAVIDPGGAIVVGPRRVTEGAAPEPLVLHREDWQEFCEGP